MTPPSLKGKKNIFNERMGEYVSNKAFFKIIIISV